jgi:hypothetical protein
MTRISPHTAHYITPVRHTTNYLEAGPDDGVLMNGGPHLSIM